jgi:deazaflavin-dependent oxidoreductase (nitroreductase family)
MTAKQDIPKPDFMEQEDWDMLMKTRRPEIIRLGAAAHVKMYQENNGDGDTFYTQGGPTLLLTTRGRKSGESHTSPANFYTQGENVYVVGSIAGLERHPHWALNLAAEPSVGVQVKANKYQGVARKIEGDERAKLWPSLTGFFPLWGHFQKYSDREFFVFEISPVEA